MVEEKPKKTTEETEAMRTAKFEIQQLAQQLALKSEQTTSLQNQLDAQKRRHNVEHKK